MQLSSERHDLCAEFDHLVAWPIQFLGHWGET